MFDLTSPKVNSEVTILNPVNTNEYTLNPGDKFILKHNVYLGGLYLEHILTKGIYRYYDVNNIISITF